EGMIAGEQLLEYHRTAELVTAVINYPTGLLWRHIAHRSAHRNRLANTRPRLQRTRNPKVREDQAMIFLVNQNIFRFDIAMNDRAWACMGVVKRVCQLMKIMDCLTRGKRPVRFRQARA